MVNNTCNKLKKNLKVKVSEKVVLKIGKIYYIIFKK